MSDIISPLLQWLNDHPQLAGLVTFLISATESIAIIGTIVPGSIMMTALGTLAGAGVIPLWPTILWAILGAIVGDGISYWIGHYFKERLPLLWPFRSHPALLKTGEKFFHKYGSMSVFIGRFVGPVRALVPMIAGMLGMKPWKFTIANVTSAIGWAPAYMLPGILLGAASLELPPDIAVHVILVLLLITLFVMMCLWFIYKLFQLIHEQTTQVQNWIWRGLKSRYFSPITVLLKHHDSHKTHGQLTLALFFIFTAILFICLALYIQVVGPSNIMVNEAMFHFFRGISIRSNSLDSVMIDITLLGQKQVLLPVVIILFGWLVICKRWRAAFHTLALGVLAAGSIYVIKHLLKSPRPWGIFTNTETFSMPSGHTTLAATLYIGLAFLIASSLRPNRRWPIYTVALLITFAIGISRLYLGAHWFTDVLGALLLSATLLMMVIISYQRQVEKPVNPVGILLVSIVTLCITYTFFHHKHIEQLKVNYTQLNWPTAEINMHNWWEKNESLPAYRVSLFGFPSSQINIEWVGNIDKIRETLTKEGWSKPPARDWISTVHRITGISSAEYLPMVAPQYLDNRPALVMTRWGADEENMLVIRLWDANRTIKENNLTLWVGNIGIVPRSYSWLFKNRTGDISMDPALIFPTKMGIGRWQWKIMTMYDPNGANPTIPQKIVLIRQNKSVHKKR
jgi:membrane protein DedA with SNARE-associated domain